MDKLCVLNCELDINDFIFNKAQYVVHDIQPLKKKDNLNYDLYPYQYMSIRDKTYYSTDDNCAFVGSYKKVLLDVFLPATSVTTSLYYSDYHEIVIDVDMKLNGNEKLHFEIEKEIVNLIWEILKNLNSIKIAIYCMSKFGGTAKGQGLHIHVVGIYLSRLDNLVLIKYLSNSLKKLKFSDNSWTLDENVRNWSLPFASKSGVINDVYFPYRLYTINNENPLVFFSKVNYIDTFLNVVIAEKDLDRSSFSFCAHTNTDIDNDNLINNLYFIPILFTNYPKQIIGKECNKIYSCNKNEENKILKFRNENRDFCRQYDYFKNYPWSKHPLPCSEQNNILREFEKIIYPINISILKHYCRNNKRNGYNVCYTLSSYYRSEKEKIKHLISILEIEDLYLKCSVSIDLTSYSKDVIISSLLIDVFNYENRSIDEIDALYKLKIYSGYVTINEITINLINEKKIPLDHILPYITPIIVDGKKLRYYINSEWYIRNSREASSISHLYVLKFIIIQNYIKHLKEIENNEDEKNDIKQNKKSNVKKQPVTNESNNLKNIINVSKLFWQTFKPLELSIYMFPFRDSLIFDYQIKEIISPSPLFFVRNKSQISYSEIKHIINVEYHPDDLYCSKNLRTQNEWKHIQQFLDKIFKRNVHVIDYVIDVLCQIIKGEQIKTVLYFHGSSANNGKTTFLSVLSNMFGQMMCYVSHRTIQKGVSDTNNDLLLASKCKIIAVDEISSDSKLNSSVIKLLTGNSSAYLRGIYESGKIVHFNGVLLLAGNGLPNLELTEAIIKRLAIIPFTATFTKNRQNINEDKHVYKAQSFKPQKIRQLALELFTLCHSRIKLLTTNEKIIIPREIQLFKDRIINSLDGINDKLFKMNFIESEEERDRIFYSDIMKAVTNYNHSNKLKIDAYEFIENLKRKFPFDDENECIHKLRNDNIFNFL